MFRSIFSCKPIFDLQYSKQRVFTITSTVDVHNCSPAKGHICLAGRHIRFSLDLLVQQYQITIAVKSKIIGISVKTAHSSLLGKRGGHPQALISLLIIKRLTRNYHIKSGHDFVEHGLAAGRQISDQLKGFAAAFASVSGIDLLIFISIRGIEGILFVAAEFSCRCKESSNLSTAIQVEDGTSCKFSFSFQ